MNRVLVPASCAAALVAIIALELATGEPPAALVRPGPAMVAAPQAVQPDPLPGQVAALLARPPFSPDRKPDPMPGDDPRLPHLTGIVVTRADRKAIFLMPDGGRGVVVGQGDQVGAYRVQQITTLDVTLTGADGPHTVRPTFSAVPPGQPAILQSAALQSPPQLAGIQNLQLPPPRVLGRVPVPPVANTPAVPGSGSPR